VRVAVLKDHVEVSDTDAHENWRGEASFCPNDERTRK
jgi:hypothetical protein